MKSQILAVNFWRPIFDGQFIDSQIIDSELKNRRFKIISVSMACFRIIFQKSIQINFYLNLPESVLNCSKISSFFISSFFYRFFISASDQPKHYL
jgi:hypothetical protein